MTSGDGVPGGTPPSETEAATRHRIALQHLAGLVDTDPEDGYDRLTRLARHATGAPIALFSLVGEERQFFKSAQGLEDAEGRPIRETPIRDSLCITVVETGRPLALEDAAADPVFCDHPAVTDFRLRCYLGYPVHAPDGTPLGSLCIMGQEARIWSNADHEVVRDLAALASREVALRIEAEEAEARADLFEGGERFLRRVLDGIPSALALLDPDDRVLVSNVRWAELPRSPRGDHPQILDDAEVVAGFQSVRSGAKEEFTSDLRLTIDGRDRWFHLRASAFDAEAGSHLIVRFEDLTRLREAESLLRLLGEAVDHSNDFLLITEGELPGGEEESRGPVIVFANASFLERTGYEVTEVVGRRLRLPDPSDNGEGRRIREAFAARKAVRAQVETRKKSGERFWVEVDMVPLKDLSGAVTHWVSVQRDITRRRERDARLARQAEALRVQDRLEVVGHLSAGIAHEFNNLLTVILGNLSLVPPSGEGAVEIRESTVAARKAEVLVRQLLAFSRRQVFLDEPVRIDALVEGTAAVLAGARGGSVDVRVEVGGEIPATRADPVQVEQVLLNLALNAGAAIPVSGTMLFRTRAVDHTSPIDTMDGGELPPGRYIEVEVSDSGPGVPPDLRERIFEPFFTTKPLGEGRGLGLSTALGILRQMGGSLEAGTSEELGGAAFTLRIPVRESPEPTDRPAVSPGGPREAP
ncbi:MAG: PAS domain-containing protein [Gemmatimonadales bacterium]|nr:MAG: PAS domain-containing protein [Gemmatimonadales bacterium]